MFISFDAIKNSFCIVEPANRKYDFLLSKTLPERLSQVHHFRPVISLGKLIVIDAGRKDIYFHQPVIITNNMQVMIKPQDHPDALKKMACVIYSLKAYKISAQHARNKFLLPFARHQPEYFIRRKGNVQKKTDGNTRDCFPEHTCKWQQVIIVDPDHICCAKMFNKGFS